GPPPDGLHRGKEEYRAKRSATELVRDRSFGLFQSVLFEPLRQLSIADLSPLDLCADKPPRPMRPLPFLLSDRHLISPTIDIGVSNLGGLSLTSKRLNHILFGRRMPNLIDVSA